MSGDAASSLNVYYSMRFRLLVLSSQTAFQAVHPRCLLIANSPVLPGRLPPSTNQKLPVSKSTVTVMNTTCSTLGTSHNTWSRAAVLPLLQLVVCLVLPPFYWGVSQVFEAGKCSPSCTWQETLLNRLFAATRPRPQRQWPRGTPDR